MKATAILREIICTLATRRGYILATFEFRKVAQ